MKTSYELKDICDHIIKEHGSDKPIVIQIKDDNGDVTCGGYVSDIHVAENGILYLTTKYPNYNK